MSDKDKPIVSGEIKDIQEPLLHSPKGSAEDDGSGSEKINIPDSKVRPLNEDTVSGFTQANYMNPTRHFKNDN